MDPVRLLSVDPGSSAAWVAWERVEERAWAPTRVGREPAPSPRACLNILRRLLPTAKGAHLVVEGQFYSGKKGHSPANDVMHLVELRCWWQAAAELAGATSEVVAPGVWIPAMTRNAPGDDSKARIKWICGQLLPGVPFAQDEHDAALLGAWWVRRSGGRIVLPAERRSA